MFRNVESHFAQVPDIQIQRSKMKMQPKLITSFNNGQLVPIFLTEILPGDSIKITHSVVARLQTLLAPVMDDLVLDIAWFFVPNRLVYNKWREFMQENTTGPWVQQTQYGIPTISSPTGGFAVGSLADYLGYPVGVQWSNSDKNAPSALPMRGYSLIYNEFYRDENLSYPLNIPMSDANQIGMDGTEYGYTDLDYIPNGAKLATVAKTHDYFTSCLPSAQKAAEPVKFPLISGSDAPVYPKAKRIFGVDYNAQTRKFIDSIPAMEMYAGTSGGDNYKRELYVSDPATSSGVVNTIQSAHKMDGQYYYGAVDGTHNYSYPVNLWADLSSSVGAVTVNELRLAFQLQKWYERAAVGGSRYTELIRSMFGVTSPDARLQRPEYLGGNRIPIAIDQVTSSSAVSGSPLGSLAATSDTADINVDVNHSFTEHGYLFGLAYSRIAQHTYSQGMPKHLLRKTYTDFYWPVFAHIGEQAVPEVCIYADGYMNSDSVFGFQEAWAEYRYAPNQATGLMRPGVNGSLASWHFGDRYVAAPTLSDTWIKEGVSEVDRTLAVTSATSNQVFADFAFDIEFTRPMPVYSVPGLVDHF